MSTRSIAPVLIAALLAVLCWQPGRAAHSQRLQAEPAPRDQDSDNDFLPDELEWVCLTNALSPDTDDDGNPDFVEVVQRGNPRHPGQPLPADHEMRLVVTSRPGMPAPMRKAATALAIGTALQVGVTLAGKYLASQAARGASEAVQSAQPPARRRVERRQPDPEIERAAAVSETVIIRREWIRRD